MNPELTMAFRQEIPILEVELKRLAPHQAVSLASMRSISLFIYNCQVKGANF